jgi:hypothetical protein
MAALSYPQGINSNRLFRKATSSSSRALSRLRRASSACWSFFSSKGLPVCRRFVRQAYHACKVASASSKSCATLGMPSRSARSNACSLNCAVYLLRTICRFGSFLVFSMHLGFRDYSLSQVPTRMGQDGFIYPVLFLSAVLVGISAIATIVIA